MITKDLAHDLKLQTESLNSNECIQLGVIDASKYEHNNRVYGVGGACPCVSSREYKDPLKILVYE